MKVKFTVTAPTGQCDGYAEIILGTIAFTMPMRGKPKLSRQTENGMTTISIEADLPQPPLGHLGEDDIEEGK